MIEYAARTKTLPAPPHIVWESLTQPHRPGARVWLELDRGEVEPRVLDGSEPGRLLWSSPWPDRPDDVVEIRLTPEGVETRLGFRILTPVTPPAADEALARRTRLSRLLFAELRYSFGQ